MGRPWQGCLVRVRYLLLPLLFVSVLTPAPGDAQTTLTVNTTDDVDDGTCDGAHCSLREALGAVAIHPPGVVIAFNIPGAGPHTIQPASPLPPLLGSTTLDGTTEPDFAGTPIIELDGTLAGAGAHGLSVSGTGNVIRGVVVNRFSVNGISIEAEAENNLVEGCYIGTDVSGVSAMGNGIAGVLIGQAKNNTVGGTTAAARNLISGNAEGVTVVDTSATGNLILGNYIGTNVTGDSPVPNGIGVFLLAPDNIVGGEEEGAGNVISGNTGNAVYLLPPDATGNFILGNYIGVDASGTTALGNDVGVFVDNVADNVIGGTMEGARNVISGNREGITFWEAGATGNVVQGNHVGTDAGGGTAIPNEMGIVVYSPENTIGGTEAGAGNLISGNVTNGVNFYGEYATGNTVQGNYIGTDATGTTAVGNGEAGVGISNNAIDNIIGGAEAGARNVLSGNVFGILIADLSVTGTRIQGNYIGTNADGDGTIPNTQTGILLWGESTLIGGPESGAGNVISGNVFAGIDLGPGSTGTVIQGNYIGTDATGTTVMGNELGIFVNDSPDNTIGGTQAGAGNVISGNLGRNVQIHDPGASGNTIQGNFIGTDATGTVALENGRAMLILNAPDNLIGGTASGAGNVISGNVPGISVEGADATGNLIQGNYMGVDVSGSAPLGNRGATLRFTNGASDNTVGGTQQGAGNIIANGSWVGVGVFPDAGTGNTILGNAIFDNTGQGIELNRDGVSANDEGDVDTGPNNLQNFPEITSALAGSGGAIQASLSSAPSATFTLDFFCDTVCDETGFGEGRTPLGTATLTTDATGLGSTTVSFPQIPGTLVTATATDADGNTSEFSQCFGLSTLGISSSTGTRTVTQGQSATFSLGLAATGGSFEETVSLDCSGNPSGTTCTFDPEEVTLTGGQASTTMTVTTVAPAGLEWLGFRAPWPRSENPLPLLLALTAALGVLWAAHRRGRWWNGLRGASFRCWTSAAFLVAVLAFLVASCGDDGSKPPSGGTPPGSYDLTVTATWESVQVSTSVTMVVQ